MTEEQIVTKGTEEFNKAKLAYLDLFKKDKPKPRIGIAYMKPNLKLQAKWEEIPKPFSCLHLELYIWESGSVAYFCDKIGCLCSPCREDLEGKYPSYCPPDDMPDDDFADNDNFEDDYNDYDDSPYEEF